MDEKECKECFKNLKNINKISTDRIASTVLAHLNAGAQKWIV